MSNFWLFVFSIVASCTLSAQRTFEVKTGPLIKVGDFELLNGFIGGLNSPQFTEFDLNSDGREDLIVFDRADFKNYTFLRTQKNQYTYAPQYESQLPVGQNIYVARDINSDGNKDIFTTSENGDLLIFINETLAEDTKLSFRAIGPWYYRNQYPDNFTILYNPLSFGNANTDLLGIEDIDNDGDIDIVDYDQFNLTYMMYKDVRAEKNWSKDTFEFQNMDYCFGYFWEGFDSEIRLNTCPFDLSFPLKLKPRHVGGASCWFFDEDDDGDKEMYIANLDFKRITRFTNGKADYKHDYDTMIAIDTMFLDGKSFDAYVFPAGYMVDVDADGLKDMIIAPNAAYDSKEKNQIRYYRNTGTKQKANFQLNRDNFLIEQMLDMGAFTSPTLADIDNDGDLDLLVLSNGDFALTRGLKDRISYFQNQGTLDNPKFVLVDPDFLNLSDSGIISGSITTGDINNDGNLDLLVGTLSGQLFWFSKQDNSWKYESSQLIDFSREAGETSWSPAIFDYNKDGISDLLIGFYNGNVALLEGQGSDNGMPKFKLLSKYAWGMKSNEWLQNLSDPNFASYGYAAPTVGDIDNDGNVEVIIGGHQNILRVYHIEGHEVTDSLIADENILFQTYQGDTNYYSAGGRLKPTVGNLVGDSAQELILGNIRGGLVFGSHIVSSTTNIQREKITKSTHLSVFPNPVKIGDRLQIVSPDKTFSWVVILRDVSGKTIATNHINTGEKAISISSENLSNGVYFIELQNFEHSKSHYAKFITTE